MEPDFELRLAYRPPCHVEGVLEYLAARAIDGIEEVVGAGYRRSIRLPHAPGVLEMAPGDDAVRARFWLQDPRDLEPAVAACRRLLDLDRDPAPILELLGHDGLIGPVVRAAPGRRVAGTVDGGEIAIRAVLGQQVSVAGAATLAARLVAAFGERLERPVGAVSHLFPSPDALAAAGPERLPMPHTRRRALIALSRVLADRHVVFDGSLTTAEVEHRLLALPGIGPWTTGYVAMRALGDPDAFLPTDLGMRHALELLGCDGRPATAARIARRWRPYRAYATQYLWAYLVSRRTDGARRGRTQSDR